MKVRREAVKAKFRNEMEKELQKIAQSTSSKDNKQ
jgi:DNA topoisomerase IA